MKIAVPVKMNKDNSAIAPLFGKAKWFAIIEDEKIMIEKNPAEGGRGPDGGAGGRGRLRGERVAG